jgi:hypothetical protein
MAAGRTGLVKLACLRPLMVRAPAFKLGRNDSRAGSLDSHAWRCRAQKEHPTGTHAPSIGKFQ